MEGATTGLKLPFGAPAGGEQGAAATSIKARRAKDKRLVGILALMVLIAASSVVMLYFGLEERSSYQARLSEVVALVRPNLVSLTTERSTNSAVLGGNENRRNVDAVLIRTSLSATEDKIQTALSGVNDSNSFQVRPADVPLVGSNGASLSDGTQEPAIDGARSTVAGSRDTDLISFKSVPKDDERVRLNNTVLGSSVDFEDLSTWEHELDDTKQVRYNGTNARQMLLQDLGNASLEMIAVKGWPLCYWQNMCFHKGQVYPRPDKQIFRPTHESESYFTRIIGTNALQRRCLSGSAIPKPYERELPPRPENSTRILYVNGTTMIIDTFLRKGLHYDHVLAKTIQFFFIQRAIDKAIQEEAQGRRSQDTIWFNNQTLERLADVSLDQIAMMYDYRIPGPKAPLSTALSRFALTTIGRRFASPDRSFSYYDARDHDLICFEKSLEARLILERTMINEAELKEWIHFVSHDWRPWRDHSSRAECLSESAPVLFILREEGARMRKILNPEVMEDVLVELGVICDRAELKRVTFGSRTSLEDQAQIFKEYALLLSAHSSQLRNMAFSHPLSMTLELRGGPREWTSEWARSPSPFCVKYLCPTIFNVSANHDPKNLDYTSKGWRKDVPLSRDRLKRDLEQLMARQREALLRAGCPLLPMHNRIRHPCTNKPRDDLTILTTR